MSKTQIILENLRQMIQNREYKMERSLGKESWQLHSTADGEPFARLSPISMRTAGSTAAAAEHITIVCIGDLALDCSDFPVDAAKKAALCVSELTHFDPIERIQYFKQIKPQKLIFNHVAASLTGKISEFSNQVGYPVIVAEDGDEFSP